VSPNSSLKNGPCTPFGSKVELIGLQDQKIWVEISNTKAVQLGIPVTAIQGWMVLSPTNKGVFLISSMFCR
jgi:hypothetical protein